MQPDPFIGKTKPEWPSGRGKRDGRCISLNRQRCAAAKGQSDGAHKIVSKRRRRMKEEATHNLSSFYFFLYIVA